MKGILAVIFELVARGLLFICAILLAAAGIVWFFGYPEKASTIGLYCLFSFIGAFLFIGLNSLLMDN